MFLVIRSFEIFTRASIGSDNTEASTPVGCTPSESWGVRVVG